MRLYPILISCLHIFYIVHSIRACVWLTWFSSNMIGNMGNFAVLHRICVGSYVVFPSMLVIWKRSGASFLIIREKVLEYIKTVLVSSGCYNKLPQTEWLIYNRNLFLTLLEAESSRSRTQHGQVLVRALFRIADWQLMYHHMVEREGKELSGIPFIRALISFMRAPTSWPIITSWRPHLLTLGVRI